MEEKTSLEENGSDEGDSEEDSDNDDLEDENREEDYEDESEELDSEDEMDELLLERADRDLEEDELAGMEIIEDATVNIPFDAIEKALAGKKKSN